MAHPIDLETNVQWAKATYAGVVGNAPSISDPSKLIFPQKLYDAAAGRINCPFIRPIEVKEGCPAVIFTEQELEELDAEAKLTLIGKFQLGHPKMDLVRKFFDSLNFQGHWKIGLLDGRHLLFNFTSEEDYAMLFAKQVVSIGGADMKIIKWTPDFDPSKDPPIVPIWFKFPNLPYRYFNQSALFQIGRTIGNPLKLDAATINKAKPEMARIQIERDLSLPEIKKIWIGSEKEGQWQEVIMQQKPHFCTHCKMFGHINDKCYRLHPPAKRTSTKDKVIYKEAGNEVQEVSPVEPSNVFTQTFPSHMGPHPKGLGTCSVIAEPRTGCSNEVVEVSLAPTEFPPAPIEISEPVISEMQNSLEGTWHTQTSRKKKKLSVEVKNLGSPLTVGELAGNIQTRGRSRSRSLPKSPNL